MADNIQINAATVVGGKTVATKDFGGIQHEQVINEFVDAFGDPVKVSANDPMPVTDALVQQALAAIIIALNPKASTSVVTSVGDLNTNQTLLAANAARLGAMIYNNSSAVLYIKFGTIASSSDFTVLMVSGAYYEVPFSYTGNIDGIWASDAGGAALITQLT